MPREPWVVRNIRTPRSLWDAAKAKADEQGVTISEVIRSALERYVRSK